MRTRYNVNANDIVENCKIFLKDKECLNETLNQNIYKCVCIEIGMGKGNFITQMASLNPDKIYIGIERSNQVLALAIKKLNRYEEENNVKLNNLYFMCLNAVNISEYFDLKKVDKVFLNFSDPWPKKKHIKRRLTYKTFLEEYKKILKEDGIIEFKTDNRELFEFSLVSTQNFGMKFLEVYLDLHKADVPNIQTEYEKKFSPFGPIYKLVAKF